MVSEKILEVVATFIKQPTEGLLANLKNAETGEFLNDDEQAAIIREAMSSRLDSFKKENLGEATRKTMIDFEKKVKSEFGIDESLQGIDLIKKVVEKKSQETGKGAANVDFSKWTLDEWAKNEHFMTAAQNAAKTFQEKYVSLERDFTDYKEKEAKMTHEKEVFDFLRKKLLSMNPNGLQNKGTADKKIEHFLKSTFDPKHLRFDNGELYELDENGEIKKDKSNVFAPILAEKTIKAEWYDGFNHVPKANNPPAPNGSSGGGTTISKQALDNFFKENNLDGYVKFVNQLKGEERSSAMDYWRKLTA